MEWLVYNYYGIHSIESSFKTRSCSSLAYFFTTFYIISRHRIFIQVLFLNSFSVRSPPSTRVILVEYFFLAVDNLAPINEAASSLKGKG